jgi:hypothetical protein
MPNIARLTSFRKFATWGINGWMMPEISDWNGPISPIMRDDPFDLFDMYWRLAYGHLSGLVSEMEHGV